MCINIDVHSLSGISSLKASVSVFTCFWSGSSTASFCMRFLLSLNSQLLWLSIFTLPRLTRHFQTRALRNMQEIPHFQDVTGCACKNQFAENFQSTLKQIRQFAPCTRYFAQNVTIYSQKQAANSGNRSWDMANDCSTFCNRDSIWIKKISCFLLTWQRLSNSSFPNIAIYVIAANHGFHLMAPTALKSTYYFSTQHRQECSQTKAAAFLQLTVQC